MTESAAPQALGFEGFFRGAYSYHFHNFWYVNQSISGLNALLTMFLRWKPFDPARDWPDLGQRFKAGEQVAREALKSKAAPTITEEEDDNVEQDRRDLDWATVLKRTFESYIRGERPNMYGEWLMW